MYALRKRLLGFSGSKTPLKPRILLIIFIGVLVAGLFAQLWLAGANAPMAFQGEEKK